MKTQVNDVLNHSVSPTTAIATRAKRRVAGVLGSFQHALVIAGQVAGTWRTVPGAKELVVDVTTLRRLTAAERRGLTQAGARYGRFSVFGCRCLSPELAGRLGAGRRYGGTAGRRDGGTAGRRDGGTGAHTTHSKPRTRTLRYQLLPLLFCVSGLAAQKPAPADAVDRFIQAELARQRIHTWTPLGCERVRDRDIARLRSRIEYTCYAKGTGKQGSLLFTVLYGKDWRAAGIDNFFGI